MKTLTFIFSALIFLFFADLLYSCNAQSAVKQTDKEPTDNRMVKVYYFHFTRRCATCLHVEEQSKLAVKSLYPYEIEEGRISFEAVNIEEKSGEKLAKETGVYGQALLIVKGEEKIDLTSEGFLYSTYNPQKLRQVLKEKIDPLLFQ